MKTHRSYSLFTITFSLVFAAALSGVAKTFDWPVDAPTAIARQFTAYHGETVRFNLRLGGAMTNLTPAAIYYQTNGMGKAEWFGPVPGTVFHPTNDCGAAAYRFFILCNDPDGKDYTANGSLRLLDSPGFVPNEVPLPVQSLDFAKIEVLNPPWGEGPGNYQAVSNAAMNAVQPSDLAAATNATATSIDAKRDKADLSVYAWRWSEWTFSGSRVDPSKTYSINLFPEQWDGRILWTFDMREDGEPLNTYELVLQEGVEPDFVTLITPDMWMEHSGMDVTATRRRVAIPTDDRLATTAGVARAISDVAAQLDAATSTNAAQSAALAAQASQLSQQSQSLSTLGSQVSAIGSYLNAEDARLVVTNYDSAVSTPEASVDVRLTESGTNKWMTIWREMTRWNKFTGLNFDWQSWTGFHAFRTNVTTELSYKADRAWGAYDSETGGWSPEGYTQISSSNILIAAGMAYQRTITTGGAVWVLQCNSGTAHIGGDTNGFFRVIDGDGNVQFEIVKGNKAEMGADAGDITVTQPGDVITIPYSVEAAEHPTISCCNNLATANWKDETDADCLCTVSWSGSSGAWVATVTPKTAQPSMFVKASYMAGGETYIRNVAPVGMDSIMLNGTKYYLGTATISGHTVLTLSTSPIVQ